LILIIDDTIIVGVTILSSTVKPVSSNDSCVVVYQQVMLAHRLKNKENVRHNLPVGRGTA